MESNTDELDRRLTMMCCNAIIAFLLVLPPVLTSDACGQLGGHINNLRTVGNASGEGMMDDSMIQRLAIIETWMQSLNSGAGPGAHSVPLFVTSTRNRLPDRVPFHLPAAGFVMFRAVLSKSLLLSVIVKSFSYALILKKLEEIFVGVAEKN